MSFAGGLNTSVDLSNINISKGDDSSTNWVAGYPNLSYGLNPFVSITNPANPSAIPANQNPWFESPDFTLPLQVSSFPNVWSMVNYSISPPSTGSMDLAYDIWITQNQLQFTSAGASAPGICSGDVELMIWTYQTGFAPSTASYTGQPLLSSQQIPTWINGTLEYPTWNAFVGQSGSGNGTANCGYGTLVTLALASPLASAYIGVNLNEMITGGVIPALTSCTSSSCGNTTWTASELNNYWVDSISLGSEFGCTGVSCLLPNQSVSYSYDISPGGVSDYCFVIAPPGNSNWNDYNCQTVTATISTPTVTVTPASSSISTTQALSVTVAVSGGNGNPTATGTVTLTSGSYSSAATTLSSGSATISIPAGSLTTGVDTLIASYTPDSSSSSTYGTASGSGTVTVTGPSLITPTVAVTPSSSSVTTAQSLSVTVTVSGGTGNPTPTGSVTLSGPGYTSAPTTLSSGAATISVPAGSFSTGTDTLTVSYAPDATSSPTYNAATGTATVTVTQAQVNYLENVLYTFTGGSDGGQPYAGLISDAKGNLYGTAEYGGNETACPAGVLVSGAGCGVVFELSPPSSGNGPWTETVLYSFTGGSDGAYPKAGLIFDQAGNLYGTTTDGGGSSAACGTFGCGIVFELSPVAGGGRTESIIYRFQGGSDGAGPQAGLIFDSKGNLYGTTSGGGADGSGTVFVLSPPSSGSGQWIETVLYSFTGGSDGANPEAGLIFDQSGNLYGTTSSGGTANAGCAYIVGQCGSVFELAPQSNGGWIENTLYSFQGNADSDTPLGEVIIDTSGNLYGTTSGDCAACFGTAFELAPSSGGTWTETSIYTFQGVLANGWTPEAGLVFDHSGNLYGTTAFGGSSGGSENCIGNGTMGVPNGCGTVFELSPSSTGAWAERVLYSFQGYADGGYPEAGLILDSQGNLYGTTTSAGANNGSGVVFELIPAPSGTTASTTTLSLSLSSVAAGSGGPVIMTATIAPASGSGTPTGTTTFFNGSTEIGTGALSGGVATFDYNPNGLAAGTYSITASYSGDDTFAGSSSSAQTLTVKATYSMSATAVTVSPGASGTSTVTVNSTNGYAGTLTLTCSVTSSPKGATDLPTCSSTQTVTLNSNTTSGTATVTVNTTAASSAAVVRPKLRERQGWGAAGEGAVLALLALLGIPAQRRKWQSLLGLLAVLAVLSAVTACGGGGGGGAGTTQPTNPGTTAGTYTITVTGTGNDSAKTTATTTFILTVN